nr:MAG TPA: hypothetical protein [Caudoviricetes sp.]
MLLHRGCLTKKYSICHYSSNFFQKIPRKFLARFNLNAYLCHRYNIHVEHST